MEHPTRAPVLCLHGMFAGTWAFEQLMPMIAARGYPTSALAFRGHPPNDALSGIGGVSLLDYLEDASVAAGRLGRPIVIGHSMGGLVALMLAARNLVRAAVLVSPAPPRGIPIFSPPLLARMARYLPALIGSRPFIANDADFDALVLNAVPSADRAAIRARMVPDSGRAARQIAIGMFPVEAKDIHVPVLITGSEFDRFIPIGIARRMARRYDVALHVAQNHGHFLFGEPGWRDHANVMLNWIDALPHDIRDASPPSSTAAHTPLNA